jgi:hypothetical protein
MDQEVWKALLNFIVAGAGLLLTWFIGYMIGDQHAEKRKRRELDLALASSFYTHYGEFRAVWKLWNRLRYELQTKPPLFEPARRDLLERANHAEGGLEAALLKLASERVLTRKEQEDLGNLRQAFQVLRERIELGEEVSYGKSQDPDYLEFKRLATRFGVLLASSGKLPKPGQAKAAFWEITHNKYEPRWKTVGRHKAKATSGAVAPVEVTAQGHDGP